MTEKPGSSVAVPARPTSRRTSLDILRVIAICGVVAIHTFGLMVSSNQDKHGGAEWWTAVVLDRAFGWAVPVFVMISGALVLQTKYYSAGAFAFYRKRALRIVPALIVWNLVYLILVRIVLRGERPGFGDLYTMAIDGTIYTALYFLWVILGLYLVAPILASFLRDDISGKRARWLALVALVGTVVIFVIPGLSAYAGYPRPISLTILTMWMPYVGYFVAGYALSKASLSRTSKGLGAVALVLISAFSIWQYGVQPSYPLLQALNPISYQGPTIAATSVLVFVLAVSILEKLEYSNRFARLTAQLSDASFGVFLVHLAIIALVQRFAPALADGGSMLELVPLYAGVMVVSYAISIAASKVAYLRRVF